MEQPPRTVVPLSQERQAHRTAREAGSRRARGAAGALAPCGTRDGSSGVLGTLARDPRPSFRAAHCLTHARGSDPSCGRGLAQAVPWETLRGGAGMLTRTRATRRTDLSGSGARRTW